MYKNRMFTRFPLLMFPNFYANVCHHDTPSVGLMWGITHTIQCGPFPNTPPIFGRANTD